MTTNTDINMLIKEIRATAIVEKQYIAEGDSTGLWHGAITPDNALIILDALEAAQERIAELENNHRVHAARLLDERGLLKERIAELEAFQPVVSDGYCLMPLSLTAENGAKNALSGEFHTIEHIGCVTCGGDGIDGDDECDNCDGSGDVVVQAPVSWTTIKDIYKPCISGC